MRKKILPGNGRLPGEEPSPRRALELVVDALVEALPRTWSASLDNMADRDCARSARRELPDATLVLCAPDGSSTRVAVSTRRKLDPKLATATADGLARARCAVSAQAGMVVAPYLSPRARALLAEAGLGYGDATGSLRLALARPALFVQTHGASADPWARPGDRPLKSLKGPAAGRIVRALCDFRPPYGVEQLARRSGTSLGTVSRVFALLEPEGLIVREPRGPVPEVRWADLLRRWTEDYAFARTNVTRAYLEPRGLPALLAKLRGTTLRYAVTGSLAAAQVAPVAAPRLAALYVDDLDAAADALGLRRAESGANVLLAAPFDPVVFDRAQRREGVVYAALSQVAADLLTGPGRSPAEGEELLHWMREHEDAWRT